MAETRGFCWFIGQMARHERRQRAAAIVGVDLADGLYNDFDSDTQCILWSLVSQVREPLFSLIQPWLDEDVPSRRNLEI